MAVMDEFKEERESIKHAPLKKKIEYFMDYYKWHTIVVIMVLIFAGTIISGIGSAKDIALQAIFINVMTQNENVETLNAEVAEQMEIDPETEEVIIDATYYLDYEYQSEEHSTYIQKLVTMVAAKMLDTAATDESTYAQLAYIGMFQDLSKCLSEEKLELYGDRVVYIDRVVVDEIDRLSDEMASVEDYPEYIIGSTEGMDDPVAVGIYIGEETRAAETFLFREENAVIGILANSTRVEGAVSFIEYVLEQGE